jgi:tetratricopeptide (TPR) repeat protein
MTLQDYTMSKVFFLPVAAAMLMCSACAQQPRNSAASATGAHTASADWTLPARLAQTEDQDGEDEAPSLEDRARAMFKDKPLSGTLPQNELNSELLFKYLVAEIASQRGNVQAAAQGFLELAKTTRDPRLAKRATELAAFGRLQTLALESAKLWLELDKNNPQAKQTVAALLVSNNKLSEAKPYLEALLAADGNVGTGFMQLHSLLGKHPDRNAVLSVTRDLAKTYPQLPEAHFAVAQAAIGANNYDLATTEVKEALRLKPDWELGALLNAQIIQEKQSNANALEYLRGFLDTYPKSREVRANYARLLIASKQLKEARDQYQLMLNETPTNPDVVVTMGLLSLQMNDYDQAETSFKRALELKYRDMDTLHFYLGQVYEEKKQYDEAMKQYSAVAGGEQYVASQARYAFLLARQNKVAEAREYLQNVKATTDEQRALLVQAEAQVLREAKDYQGSFDVLNKALQAHPDQPDLLYDSAMAAEKLDRIDVVETNLRKLISLKPDHAQAYNALGYTLADRTDRFKEAKQYIEKALTLSPDDPFILDSMGWVLYRMGNAKEGLDFLQRAFAKRPDPEIAAHIGEVLWARGQKQDAEKVWRDASKGSPDNELLQSTMKRFMR